MSKTKLEPYDIVRGPYDLGVVMRNDEDSGLLIAYPSMDELTIARPEQIKFVANIKEFCEPPRQRTNRKKPEAPE